LVIFRGYAMPTVTASAPNNRKDDD
jgi:hypothetical protein